MPVVGPEEQGAQRGRQPSPPHPRSHADEIVAAVELRLDEDRPAIDLAQIIERLLECWKALLLPVAHVPHHVAVADSVIRELAPQGEVHDVRVEPQPPLAIDTRIEIESQRDAVTQGIPNVRVDGIFDPRVEQEDAMIDVYIRGSNFKHA